MSLFVSTNVLSSNATRQLFTSTNNLNTTFKRLLSNLRINRAKDDTAGLQISNLLTTQVLGWIKLPIMQMMGYLCRRP
jgi:flagellin